MLTVNEVAELLHVSRATVYRLIDDGLLVAAEVKRGRFRKLIDPAEVDRYQHGDFFADVE